ncbi:UNVERIFIED_CONTAM: hypothetical protein GTU68_057562 [Idotea baltica]|nr:hypothetical protein [Idotea baltica]
MALRGEFRADLLDRLAFDVITIPPLRERKEDITLLAEYYAIKMCRELELELFVGFAPAAVEALLDYSWPGNVRELKNVIERAVYQHGKDTYPIESLVFNPFKPAWKIDQDSTHEIESSFSLPLDYKAWQEQQDIKLLNQALKQSKYNQKQAAELLGLTYNQLRGMVRKYAIVGQANDK